MAPLACLLALSLGANPYLDEGRKLYDQVRYRDAEAKLQLAREAPGSTDAERRETFDLLAKAVAAQGRLDEAERVYAELLTWDPHAAAPEAASPKIRDLFKRAKERVYPRGFVKLNQLPAAAGRVDAEVIDPWTLVASVELAEATSKEGPFARQPLEVKSHRVSAELAPPSADAALFWFVEARSKEGKVVSSLGTVSAPNVRPALVVADNTRTSAVPEGAVATSQEQAPPRWVAYSLVGASAVLFVTSGVLLYAADQDYQAAGRARFASDTAVLDRRYEQKDLAAKLVLGGAIAAGVSATVLFWRWQ